MPEKCDVRGAFDAIRAEKALTDATMEFLQDKLERRTRRGARLPVGALAACLAVFAVVLMAGVHTAYRGYYTENAYIALDVNPSVGLSINRYDRVIEVYPYNAEGQKVLSGTALLHKSYDDAVETLVNAVVRQGYLEEDGLVAISLQTNLPEREMALFSGLQSDVDRLVAVQAAQAQTEIVRVDSAVKDHAHAQGVSPAKYLAILELQEVDPSATVAGCRGHSIGEIRRQTRQHMGHGDEEQETPAVSGGGMGGGHGHRGGH